VVSTDHDPRFQRLADGLLLPAALAGDAALDFCNTRAGWNADEPREYLTSYDHLAVWTREAGLVDASAASRLRRRSKGEPAAASRALSRALRLRDAIYSACTEPGDDEAWQAVAAEARRAAAAAVLVRGSGWIVPESAGLDLPTLEVARAAGSLLASPELEIVGCCPGNDCGWLFLDPRGRRRWCTMAVCGNRAKARRHALRTRA
jgi:predicted RNA-binding Zn ribbon-like protein